MSFDFSEKKFKDYKNESEIDIIVEDIDPGGCFIDCGYCSAVFKAYFVQ